MIAVSHRIADGSVYTVEVGAPETDISTALAGLTGFILRRGAATAIPVVGQALAAAMLLVTGVRAFSGPAYSITTLAVLVIGVIRERMEREALNQEMDLVVKVVEAFDLPRETVMRTVASD